MRFFSSPARNLYGGRVRAALGPFGLALCALFPVAGRATGDMRTAWVGHRNHGVIAVALSPDGKRLASCGSDATVRVWDIKTEKCLHTFTFDETNRPGRVAFLPTGEGVRVSTFRLVNRRFVGGGEVWRFDLRTGEGKREWTAGEQERIVALWADKDQAVATFEVEQGGEWRYGLKVVHLATGKVSVQRWQEPCRVLGFSLDRKLALSDFNARKVLVIDIASGKAIGGVPLGEPDPSRCVLAPDHKTLVTLIHDLTLVRRGIDFWDIRTGKEKGTRKTRSRYDRFGDTSPDGRYLALLGGSAVTFYDLKESALVPTGTVPWGRLNCLSFTPDSRTFATGSTDGTICVFDLPKE